MILTDNKRFVAMQYYGLILNRTYLVLLTKDFLIGIKVNGLVSAEGGTNLIAKEVAGSRAVKGDLQNPYSDFKSKYITWVKDCDLTNGSVLKLSRSNFMIKREDIIGVSYDSGKKWGMGYYPHDGKVYILTRDGKRKELIILGNQSGENIADLILAS